MKRSLLIFWFAAVSTGLLGVPAGNASDINRLAIRSKMRPLQAADGIRNTIDLSVDLDVLRQLALDGLDEVLIPVLEVDVIFHKISQKTHHKITSWAGKDPTGGYRVQLTIGDDHFFGKVISDGKTILFEPGRTNNQAVSYLVDNAFKVPLLDDAIIPYTESRDYSSIIQSADDGSRIDVMMLYTNGMAIAHPGSQIETRIQYLIDQANYALSNSGINTQFNLVHSEMVTYPDDSPNDMGEALDELTDNIGVFDNIEAMRTEYGADQVTLLRQFVDEACGMAWLLQHDSARYAYAVVHDGSKTDGSGWYCSDLVFAHEIGHNLGCAHDRANSDINDGRYSYSFGFQSPVENFHTVMSYDCPGGCPEIPYYSNPYILYDGEPIGIADPDPDSADNAATINQTRTGMAGYRPESLPNITLIAPNGGEVWKRGTSHDIVWTSTNLTGNVVIELFQAGILSRTITSETQNTGIFIWQIPLSLPLESDYRIRLSGAVSQDIFDESDENFAIAEAINVIAMPWLQLLLIQ